jgi:hypothetical protein
MRSVESRLTGDIIGQMIEDDLREQVEVSMWRRSTYTRLQREADQWRRIAWSAVAVASAALFVSVLTMFGAGVHLL